MLVWHYVTFGARRLAGQSASLLLLSWIPSLLLCFLHQPTLRILAILLILVPVAGVRRMSIKIPLGQRVEAIPVELFFFGEDACVHCYRLCLLIPYRCEHLRKREIILENLAVSTVSSVQ